MFVTYSENEEIVLLSENGNWLLLEMDEVSSLMYLLVKGRVLTDLMLVIS